MSMNSCNFVGRLAKDPELRYTKSGKSVCNFSIAVPRDVKNGDKRQADFFDVTVWNGGAEYIKRYCAVGDWVSVGGRLEQSKWTDNDGTRHTKVNLNATHACKIFYSDADESNAGKSTYGMSGRYDEIDDSSDDFDMPF